jgi:positive regulator of sigma E activity
MSARRRRVAYPTYENDALAHAMAMVAVPVLFGLLGAWLDGRAGTRPVLLLVFAAFGVACSFASAYYRYEAKMARHDEGKPWSRKRGPSDAAPPEREGEIGEAPA